jgi:ABC-type Mn2+/Zn2+ transport system permease subunit
LYLVGAAMTAVVTFALARHWRDMTRPAAHTMLLSVVAGALWPLVVVGALQLGAIALVVAMIRGHRDTASDYALAR